LADVIGRKPVLVASAATWVVSFVVLGFARSLGSLLIALVLYAVGRALASGPLESWFVDEVHQEVPEAEHDTVITRALGRSNAAIGIAVAIASLASGALAALAVRWGLPGEGSAPLIGLSVPVLLAAVLVVVYIVALFRLVDEERRPRVPLSDLLKDVPQTVRSGLSLLGQTPMLRWFAIRWLVIPVGFLAFELVTPVRLDELLTSSSGAAGVMGVAAASAYFASSLTAPLASWLAQRVGRVLATALLTAGAGFCFAAAGFGGVVGLVAAIVGAHLIIGPVNPLTGPILHSAVDAQRRATMLSIQSLFASVAVGVGAVAIGQVIEASTTRLAFLIAGLLTALGALPLIGVAREWRTIRPDQSAERTLPTR
jgi:MFS family permease